MDEELLDEVNTEEEGEPVEPGDAGDSPPVDEDPVPPVEDEGDRPDIDWDEEGVEGDAHPQQTFTSQPVPPYYEGDIWVNGTSEYVCIETRLTGSFTDTDWTPAVNPEPTPTIITRTVTRDEVIQDYSAASLAAYEAAGAVPYAVYDDGTEVQVTWAEVYDPSNPALDLENEAYSIASATNQYFWHRSEDTGGDGAGTGAFVTDVPQEDFLAAAAQDFPDIDTNPYMNQLINSQGTLLRSGKTNLVSYSRSGTAYYTGEGNTAADIMARYGREGAQIGADSSPHLLFNSSGLQGLTPESVAVFDISMDGAVTREEFRRSWGNRWGTVEESEGTYTYRSGGVLTVPASAQGTMYYIHNSGWVIINTITTVLDTPTCTGDFTLGGTLDNYIELLANAVEAFTVGTSRTITLNGTITYYTSRTETSTIQVAYTVVYDSVGGTITHDLVVTSQIADLTAELVTGWLEGTTQTNAPAYTLGIRSGTVGNFSTLIGRGIASGNYSTSAGVGNTASGATSFAQGSSSQATKDVTVAMGARAKATQQWAQAFGYSAEGSGYASHAIGTYSLADHDLQTVVGYANESTDAIFAVGAGVLLRSEDVTEEGVEVTGYTLDSRANTFEVRAGGKLTAGGSSSTEPQIAFQTENYTSLGIRAYDNGTTYGHEMLIQSGAGMIVGAGEYPTNRYALGDIKDQERLYLGSDNQVFIETNANSIANRKTFTFSNTGDFLLPVDGKLYRYSSAVINNATPSTTQDAISLYVRDENDVNLARFGARQTSTWQGAIIDGARTINGTTYWNSLMLGVDTSGNQVVSVAGAGAPAAWRKALGLSYAAGDTWTMPSSANQMPCAGMITSGNTAIYFFIPLDRRIDATSCTVSGNVSVRSSQGYLYPSTSQTSTYYFAISNTTVNTAIVPGGVRVMMTMSGGWVTNSSGTAATGNRDLNVALLSNFKITFA